jgi:hypothetical protein
MTSKTVTHDDDPDGGLTRRTVLAGAAATAAATMTATTPAAAQSVVPNSDQDMLVFVRLSAALTGIVEAKLAPSFNLKGPTDPGSDPVNIKEDYFIWLNDHRPAAFENLLRMMRDSLAGPNPAQSILAKLQFQDDQHRTRSEIEAKYLARSIVLMWYLGAWYDPDDLESAVGDHPKNPDRTINFTVISPKAYTQAWALRVAQAHPMGFSQMQFGYWHRPPNQLSDFIG